MLFVCVVSRTLDLLYYKILQGSVDVLSPLENQNTTNVWLRALRLFVPSPLRALYSTKVHAEPY